MKLTLTLVLGALLLIVGTHAAAEDDATAVRIANLVYAGDMTGVCFADDFLDSVGRETDIDIERQFAEVRLDSDTLFGHPLAIMTGEGEFTLSEQEKQNLRDFVDRGGVLVASAGCSNAAWGDSFHALVDELWGDEALEPLAMDHPIFHTLYEIESLDLRKPMPVDNAIYGVMRDGRLAVIFSPVGLNDTANAGEGCCCCGGNEIQNARLVNANIVVYALTH